MQRERQRHAGQDERRKRAGRPVVEPIVMAARRPRNLEDAPRPADPAAAATPEPSHVEATVALEANASESTPQRRSARIVATPSPNADAARVARERLLARFMASEGRATISRTADDCRRSGVDFPLEQAVQLQLLEHVDEALARDAIGAIGQLLATEAPLKRPILEQRLRRLEESADEEATRSAAADLRRALRA